MQNGTDTLEASLAVSCIEAREGKRRELVEWKLKKWPGAWQVETLVYLILSLDAVV